MITLLIAVSFIIIGAIWYTQDALYCTEAAVSQKPCYGVREQKCFCDYDWGANAPVNYTIPSLICDYSSPICESYVCEHLRGVLPPWSYSNTPCFDIGAERGFYSSMFIYVGAGWAFGVGIFLALKWRADRIASGRYVYHQADQEALREVLQHPDETGSSSMRVHHQTNVLHQAL